MLLFFDGTAGAGIFSAGEGLTDVLDPASGDSTASCLTLGVPGPFDSLLILSIPVDAFVDADEGPFFIGGTSTYGFGGTFGIDVCPEVDPSPDVFLGRRPSSAARTTSSGTPSFTFPDSGFAFPLSFFFVALPVGTSVCCAT